MTKCQRAGCYHAVDKQGQYCADCRRVYGKKKQAREPFYATKQWKQLRRLKLTKNPFCEQCERLGLLESATQVDHIVPIADGGSKTQWSNLQSLCQTHHSQKTADERIKERRERLKVISQNHIK